MSETTKIGSVKRFGVRYGRKLKKRYGIIEKEQRKLHKCPYCNAVKVKRLSVGIWLCSRCNSKFTGKAYSVKRKITFKEEEPATEETQQPVEEEEQQNGGV